MSGRGRRSTPRRPGNGTGQVDDTIPGVYKDMLAEAASSEPSRFGHEGRTIKRRRIGYARDTTEEAAGAEGSQDEPGSVARPTTPPDDAFEDLFVGKPAPQVVYDDSQDSEESDVDWEEVDLSNDKSNGILGFEDEGGDSDDGGDLDLVLDDPKSSGKRSNIPKRKPITAVERKLRLEVHKMHVLCLLHHVFLRNSWCNDPEAQTTLKPLLTSRTVSLLSPDPSKTQFQRTTLFTAGLTEAGHLWASKFKVKARGMKKAVWVDDEEKLKNYRLPEDVDLLMDKSDFRDYARKLEGSRDIGTQLFCALLRSVGVATRLVCSLQPLPFNFGVAAKRATPQRPRPNVIYPTEDGQGHTNEETYSVDARNVDVDSGSGSGPNQGALPESTRRLWQPNIGRRNRDSGKAPTPKGGPRVKRIRESAYPVYWVEAFNVAHQKWIPVDPLTTHSAGKSSKFEPPTSEAENSMSYVVAFEDAGNARDVTRRYVKAINAKTRKLRVEATKGGDRWWKKTMAFFEREYDLDRDQVEDAELASREAHEEMPRNVQDFQNHPYYALERHLRRNEIIHPKREVGKLTTGSASKGKGVETIYRRSDVHVVKSADSWYRVGRDIKPGEQPLKHIQPRRSKVHSLDDDEGGDSDGGAGTGLYAAFQTVIYEPPPVVCGRIPKNSYENIDVYVPSMVPKGGVHLAYPDAARAARLLRVDYADAVIGFEFKGRRGTAIVCGIVAAAEYREALEAVVQGFADEREEEMIAKRSMRVLAFWKRFLVGLRIRERIAGYEIPGEAEQVEREVLMGQEADEEADEEYEGGGGLFPERGEESAAEPTAGKLLHKERRRRKAYGDAHQSEEEDDKEPQDSPDAALYGGGFIPDEISTDKPKDWKWGDGGGFVTQEGSTYTATGGGFLFDDGGFIPEDNTPTSGGGGFLPIDDSDREVVEDVTQHFHSDDGLATTAGEPSLLVEKPLLTPSDEETAAVIPNQDTRLSHSPPSAELSHGTSVDIDNTSLLSHDPEDDDAEPDWLLSD